MTKAKAPRYRSVDRRVLTIYLTRISQSRNLGLSEERMDRIAQDYGEDLPLRILAREIHRKYGDLTLTGNENGFQKVLRKIPNRNLLASCTGRLAAQYILRCLVLDFLDELGRLAGAHLDLDRQDRISDPVYRLVEEITGEKIVHPDRLAVQILEGVPQELTADMAA